MMVRNIVRPFRLQLWRFACRNRWHLWWLVLREPEHRRKYRDNRIYRISLFCWWVRWAWGRRTRCCWILLPYVSDYFAFPSTISAYFHWFSATDLFPSCQWPTFQPAPWLCSWVPSTNVNLHVWLDTYLVSPSSLWRCGYLLRLYFRCCGEVYPKSDST